MIGSKDEREAHQICQAGHGPDYSKGSLHFVPQILLSFQNPSERSLEQCHFDFDSDYPHRLNYSSCHFAGSAIRNEMIQLKF